MRRSSKPTSAPTPDSPPAETANRASANRLDHFALGPFVLGVALLSYAALRAWLLSFTWDEAYSYLQFVRRPLTFASLGLAPPFHRMSANNHFLATWLMILCDRLIGPSEWALRLPSLLALALYLRFAARLGQRIPDPLPRLALFVALTAHPYLLDFFSLARGYGLASAFALGSLEALLCAFEQPAARGPALRSLLYAALAAWAHMTMLLHLAALGLVLALAQTALPEPPSIRSGPRLRAWARRSASIAALTGAVLLPLAYLAFHWKQAGALFFGGREGFWKDTILSLAESLLYGQYSGPTSRLLVASLGVAIVFAAGARALCLATTSPNPRAAFPSVLFVLLLLESAGGALQHEILGTPYLQSRTAISLFLLAATLVAWTLAAERTFPRLARATLVSLACVLLIHLVRSANLSSVHDWKFDAETRTMLADLNEARPPTPPAGLPSLTLGVPLWFVPSANYYRVTRGLDWLSPVRALEVTNRLHDFFYLDPASARKFPRELLVPLRAYPLTGNVLAQSSAPPAAFRTVARAELDFELTGAADPLRTEDRAHSGTASGHLRTTDEFGPAFRHQLSAPGPYKAGYSLWIYAPRPRQADVLMLLTLENKTGVYWRRVATLLDFVGRTPGWYRAALTEPLPDEAGIGDTISAYLWNPNAHEVFVDDLCFVLARYEEPPATREP